MSRFADGGNHALLTGMVMGALMKLESHEFRVEAVMDGTDYTNKIKVTRPSGEYIIEVRPAEETTS